MVSKFSDLIDETIMSRYLGGQYSPSGKKTGLITEIYAVEALNLMKA